MCQVCQSYSLDLSHLVPPFKWPFPPLHQVALADARHAQILQGFPCAQIHLQVIHDLPVLYVLKWQMTGTRDTINTTPAVPPLLPPMSLSKCIALGQHPNNLSEHVNMGQINRFFGFTEQPNPYLLRPLQAS